MDDQGNRRDVVLHGVDGQHTATHHLCFGVRKGGENQTWAIYQAEVALHIECLEVLCFTRHGGNTHSLFLANDVDHRGFTHVRVTYHTYHESLIISLALGSGFMSEDMHHIIS